MIIQKQGVSQLPSDETEKQLFIIEQLLHEQMQADYARTGKKKDLSCGDVTFGCHECRIQKTGGHPGTHRLCGNRYGGCGFCHLQYLYGTWNANLRVYGRLGQMKRTKQRHLDMLIALCGCMMQEPLLTRFVKSYRHVDIIFGTHNIFKLAELIQTRLNPAKWW